MTGDAEAAGMGAPVAVADQEIGRAAQPLRRLQQRRALAEREVAGDVREARLGPRARDLDDLQARGVEHHHRREEHGAAAVVGHVHARDAAHRPEPVALLDAPAQALLERARGGHVEVEAVAQPGADPHRRRPGPASAAAR